MPFKKKLIPAIPYNDVPFVIRVYHLKESSNLDFYGYITLFFNNIDFVIFEPSSYALNILPIYSDTTLNGQTRVQATPSVKAPKLAMPTLFSYSITNHCCPIKLFEKNRKRKALNALQ